MLQTKVHLRDCIKKSHICFLREKSQEEILKALVQKAVESGALGEFDSFYEAVWQREEIISTGIGMGVALPHAKTRECNDFFIVIGIHTEGGVPWKAIDGCKVRLIFLIGGPPDLHKEYLSLLSELTRMIKDENRRHQIMHALAIEEVVNIFQS